MIDYAESHHRMKKLVDQVWQLLLQQQFSEARALCDTIVVEARLTKAQIAAQHPKETGHE